MSSAPILAPGFSETTFRENHRRRIVSIGISLLTTLLAVPLLQFSVTQKTSQAFLLTGISLLIATFIGGIAWAVTTNRFSRPFETHSLNSIGYTTRTRTYQFLAGVETVGGRIITDRDYRQCSECGVETADGVVDENERDLVLFGIPILTNITSSRFFCKECRPEIWDEPIDIVTFDLTDSDETADS